MLKVDLNCDMGEGFTQDAQIMPFISSVNIACGYHAGDEESMRRTVELALKNKVTIGAHPSYPDRKNFGRLDIMDVTLRLEDLTDIILDQINQLQKICLEFGTRLHHVKPHGALYNRAAWDGLVSSFICSAIAAADPSLILYGLSGSKMKMAAEAFNIKFMSEVFADRTYQDDGSLTPRSQSHALIENKEQTLGQVLQMIQKGTVISVNGKEVPILTETVCIHGDRVLALEFAKYIHGSLKERGIEIRSI